MSLEVHITKKLGNFILNADLLCDSPCTGILGQSGCGKSMLLKCIAGIETPDSGMIRVNDQILFDSEKKINLPPQKRGVGYLFQNYALFPSMTVRNNIAAAVRPNKLFLSAAEKKQIQDTVKEEMERCHLQGLEDHYPSQLSGGQQQRTALARMLASKPQIILLDEPFSALDSHLKDALQKEMREIIRSYCGNVLMVSHSRDELYHLSDELYIMDQGRFIQHGPIRELFKQPQSVQAAILTGCKNIAPASVLDSNHLQIPDWGLILETKQPLTERTSHIGIRAHYFKLLSEKNRGAVNSFQVRIAQIEEQPFEFDYYLKTDNGLKPFIWKTPKGPEYHFSEGEQLSLTVDTEHVMPLESTTYD